MHRPALWPAIMTLSKGYAPARGDCYRHYTRKKDTFHDRLLMVNGRRGNVNAISLFRGRLRSWRFKHGTCHSQGR